MNRSLGSEEENQYSEEEVEVVSSVPMQCCFVLLLPGPGCCRMLLGLEAFPILSLRAQLQHKKPHCIQLSFLCLNPELSAGCCLYLRAVGSRPQPAPAQL